MPEERYEERYEERKEHIEQLLTTHYAPIIGNTTKYKIVGLLLLFCLFLNQPVVHADGGAPNLAYVVGSAGISVIDVAEQRIIRTLHIDGSSTMAQLSADGSMLFIVQPDQNRTMVLDANTGKTRCQTNVPGQPSLVILSLQEDGFFVAGSGDNHIREYNPDTCTLLRTISVPGPIYGMTTALDGGVFPTHTGLYQLCVATTNQILVFDTNGQPLASYAVPSGPRHISAPPADFTIYATTQQGSVVAIDLQKNLVTPPLLTGGILGPMDYDETTHEVYVPDMQHRQVDVIAYKATQKSQTTNQPLRIFPMEGVPVSVAITNDGQLGFIALQDGHVVMLDLPGRQSMKTYDTGNNPHFVITGVYPPPMLPSSPNTTGSTQTSSGWQNGLLILFVTIFLLALIGLLLILRLLWKQQRSPNRLR